MTKTAEFINPYKLFVGAFVPNWICGLPGISQGAKLCYGRLCQYAGENGECYPNQKTLASSLGVDDRQARRYITELENVELIVAYQHGMNKPNSYRFLKHPAMVIREGVDTYVHHDRTDMSTHDRTDMSTHDRTDMSTHDRTDMSYKENHIRESLQENQIEDISGEPVCAWCTKPINSLLQRIHDVYKEQFDRCPTIVPAKDNAALKRLKDTGKSEAAIIATYKKYLTLDDQWFKDKGYNIATFVGNYDGIVTKQQGGKDGRKYDLYDYERDIREGR